MAVVGAGLVGLSLAYELACLGASVTVIDAGHPGRATDAGAGILSPVTSVRGRRRAVAVPAPGRRPLPGAAASGWQPTAPTSPGPGYGRCGILSIGLRDRTRTSGSPPSPTWCCAARPGEVTEITPEEAGSLFPPLGPVHRVLHAPGSARVDGRGMAAALRQAAAAARRRRS